MNNYHTSVLLQEVLTNLNVRPNESYIDCTLGGAGHTLAIINKGGRVLGIDIDEDSHAFVRQKMQSSSIQEGKELTIALGNFSELSEIARKNGFTDVSGILLDLGVSSHQFDTPERGFSFTPGPLDMRMGTTLQVSAKDLINGLTERELVELFERLGEEYQARKIAKSIVERRKTKGFETTEELADLIKHVAYGGDRTLHPATKVFQALRIAVNDELNVLRSVLPDALSLLRPGGRLVVISFHSLEDRIVKQTFVEFEDNGLAKIITKKPIQATPEEVLQNRRSRSAKLRCIEKL